MAADIFKIVCRFYPILKKYGVCCATAITRSILGCPLLDRNITHYSNSHQILLVGEGDFSFSLALANAFGSAENMVPISLDSKEKVLQLYECESTHKTLSKLERFGATILHGVDETTMENHHLLQLYECESTHKTLSKLERLGATILHGVDATTMENQHLLGRMRFHRIVYNFPHAGFHGREDNENVIEKHRQFLKMFFKNVRTILRETGEIHVARKAYWPYKSPGLLYHQKLMGVQVALSNISSGASAKDFEAVVREPEPERKIRTGWDHGPERKMRMGWEIERQMKNGWEPEQMKMGWEPKPERKRGMGWHLERMWTGWDPEPERQMRVGWDPMGMGWGSEQMKMGWEPKPESKTGMGWEVEVERQRRMGWEEEQMWTGWEQEQMWTGWDPEPEKQTRVPGWEPMGMGWELEQIKMG